MTPQSDLLLPVLTEFCSALGVPFGKVDVLEGLVQVLLVVVLPLFDFVRANLFVLSLAQSIGNVRIVCNLTNLQVLGFSGAVVVLILFGRE